jgi:hypothetical protein
VSNTELVASVYAVAVPPVVIEPEISSRHLSVADMADLAESFTDDGAWPSAQLIVGSAVAFEAAVGDQV